MVTPSVPPQRLPVNLVRAGRQQPQREHCVPGCGWWGCLHNALLRTIPSVCINTQFVRISRLSLPVVSRAKHSYAAIFRGVFVSGDQLWLRLKNLCAPASRTMSIGKQLGLAGGRCGVLAKGVAQRLPGEGLSGRIMSVGKEQRAGNICGLLFLCRTSSKAWTRPGLPPLSAFPDPSGWLYE